MNTTTKKYYALFDLDRYRYLQTGINSPNRKQLKEALLSYINGANETPESYRETLDNLCSVYNFRVDESNEPFEEETWN